MPKIGGKIAWTMPPPNDSPNGNRNSPIVKRLARRALSKPNSKLLAIRDRSEFWNEKNGAFRSKINSVTMVAITRANLTDIGLMLKIDRGWLVGKLDPIAPARQRAVLNIN